MTRPTYETQKNRDAAYETARELEHKANVKVEIGPPLGRWDFILHRNNKPVAIADFKERHNTKDKYPTFFISEQRVQNLLKAAEERNLQPMLFVRWFDGLHWLSIGPDAHVKRDVGGRYDRGDSKDVEYMLHYWTRDFTKV